MSSFKTSKLDPLEPIYKFAIFHSIGLVAFAINICLKERGISRGSLKLDLQFLIEFEPRLVEVLGLDFFDDLLFNFIMQKEKGSYIPMSRVVTMSQVYCYGTIEKQIEDFALATTYGEELAFNILQKLKGLKDYEKDTALLESLLGIPPYPPMTAPTPISLFNNTTCTPVPTSNLMVTILEAYLRADLWEKSPQGAMYRKLTRNYPKNLIELHVTNSDDISMLPRNEAQQIIDTFGFDAAKVHLIFASGCMFFKEPWKSQFELTGREILQYLGWDKRTDIPYSDRLKEVAKLAFSMNSLVAKVTWIEGKNRKGKPVATCPTGRIWDVVVIPKGQLNTQEQIDKFDEVLITVRPGGWTEVFLNKAGAQAQTALYEFGWLSQEVLRINQYQNDLALRLALTLSLRNRCHKDARYRVENLLRILPQSEFDSVKSDRRRRSEFKQRWDKALAVLRELGWSISYDTEPDQEWLQPHNPDRLPNGYLEDFLNAFVTITQPEPIPDFLKNRSKGHAVQSSLIRDNWSNTKIKELREAKALTQRELATRLGISQSQLQRLENGTQTIKPEIIEKLNRLTDPHKT